MHIIGFLHHYTKLWGQTYGVLIEVQLLSQLRFHRILELSPLTVDYDTEFIDERGNLVRGGILPEECLQLVFLGDKEIPFTTYRKVPRNYQPFWGRKPRTYRKSVPYSDLIGDFFAFKFKGEKLPEGLANKISGRPGGCVKIFD